MPKRAAANGQAVKKTSTADAAKNGKSKVRVIIPTDMRQHTGAFLNEIVKEASAQYGTPGISCAEDAIVIGIPLPSFSMEYLLQNTVLPLSRIIQIVGIQGSCKSGLAVEFNRWFVQYAGGIGALLEHESKFSGDWAMSIMEWVQQALLHFPCASVDEWEDRAQFLLKKMKMDMIGTPKKPGSGRTWPFQIIVDSLMGKSMAESQSKIATQGFAGRSHPIEALSITQFMRKLPSDIANWPVLFTGINHMKPSKDPHTQATIRGKPGGRGIDFMETFELEVSKYGTIDTKDYEGLALNIKCFKNSLGVTGRSIPVDVLWWDEADPETGLARQKTIFSWHASTVKLIDKLQKQKLQAKANEIKDITGLVIDGGRAHSKKLGIKKPRPYHEVGQAIKEDEAMMNALRLACGVKVRTPFRNDVDYLVQLYGEKVKLLKKQKKQTQQSELEEI